MTLALDGGEWWLHSLAAKTKLYLMLEYLPFLFEHMPTKRCKLLRMHIPLHFINTTHTHSHNVPTFYASL
jgi:hypothetical protein